MKTAMLISTLSLVTATALGHAREPLAVELYGRNAIAVAGAPASLQFSRGAWNRIQGNGVHVAQVLGRGRNAPEIALRSSADRLARDWDGRLAHTPGATQDRVKILARREVSTVQGRS